MALNDKGLTDNGAGRGKTTNFYVQYEDTLPDQSNVIANANALLAVIENEFNVTTGWFNTPAGKFGSGNRQQVNLNLPDTANSDGSFGFPGANNSGYGNPINLDSQNLMTDAPLPAQRVGMVFIAEFSEILMDISGKWNRGDSSGEGLSQFCDIHRFRDGHYNYYSSVVDQWLNGVTGSPNAARSDWVNQTFTGSGSVHGDGDSVSFGCALAFLYYLNVQLNFSINQIIAAGASTLSAVYTNLTGDSGDPFPFYLALIENVYPASTTAAIPGPVSDNPFPLARLSFWVDKNTFGKDEVQDANSWPKAFWLVVEGFSKNSFDALGVTIPPPRGPFANLAGVSISQNPDIDFENAANPQAPQRIRVPFDIAFNNALADFPASGSLTYELDASLTIGGTKVPGSDASTEFELVAGADPYFTNIDRAQNNVWYLSQDLRVFTATPGKNAVPVAGGPAITSDSVDGAYSYIQSLLGWLNDPKNGYTDGATDPFASGVVPQPSTALTGDSSVSPFTVDISGFPPNINVYKNYNFALARVRLRGTANAPSVRVFFRLWSTQTADTDYQTGTTYPSSPDSTGQPGAPLVGTSHQTLPFFATGNLSGNSDYLAGSYIAGGANNIRDVQIPSGKDRVWAYYGCFLNVYDTNNVIDGQQVQAWLNGTHHCLVAQIAYDGAPVIPGSSPESTDKLAQRKLQVTLSDNPGPASTHRIPQTFDIRPSVVGGGSSVFSDELMIDWGTIPPGSLASIYWPQVQASDVLALASQFYSTHTLSVADTHTIQCKITGGVTYVPIPTGGSENFAGLFTVDLPITVVTGQEFDVVVRRVSTRHVRKFEVLTHTLPTTVDITAKRSKPSVSRRQPVAEAVQVVASPLPGSWRYVVGTFSVKIPVTTGETMLLPEENTLSIMKWRLLQMAPSNRWYPVLERYISYIAGRVDGLGGSSSNILPSPTGVPVKPPIKPAEREYTGKVCEVFFDCFGDFEGFALSDCCGMHTFRTRESGIREIALRACNEGLLLSVYVVGGDNHRIRKITIRC